MASYFPLGEPWGEFSTTSLFPPSTTERPRGERVPGPSSPSTTVLSSFTDSPPSTIWQFHDPDPMDLSSVPEVSVHTLPDSTPFPYFGSFSQPELPAPAPTPSAISAPVTVVTRADPVPEVRSLPPAMSAARALSKPGPVLVSSSRSATPQQVVIPPTPPPVPSPNGTKEKSSPSPSPSPSPIPSPPAAPLRSQTPRVIPTPVPAASPTPSAPAPASAPAPGPARERVATPAPSAPQVHASPTVGGPGNERPTGSLASPLPIPGSPTPPAPRSHTSPLPRVQERESGSALVLAPVPVQASAKATPPTAPRRATSPIKRAQERVSGSGSGDSAPALTPSPAHAPAQASTNTAPRRNTSPVKRAQEKESGGSALVHAPVQVSRNTTPATIPGRSTSPVQRAQERKSGGSGPAPAQASTSATPPTTLRRPTSPVQRAQERKSGGSAPSPSPTAHASAQASAKATPPAAPRHNTSPVQRAQERKSGGSASAPVQASTRATPPTAPRRATSPIKRAQERGSGSGGSAPALAPSPAHAPAQTSTNTAPRRNTSPVKRAQDRGSGGSSVSGPANATPSTTAPRRATSPIKRAQERKSGGSTPAPTQASMTPPRRSTSPMKGVEEKAPSLTSTPTPLEQLQEQLAPFTTRTQGHTTIPSVTQLPGFLALLHAKSHAPPALRLHLLSILRASSKDIQSQFIREQGLQLCHQWLHDKQNTAILAETLHLLAELPVSMSALKENGKIGKTVRRLSRSNEHEPALRALAERVVTTWKAMIDSTEKKRALPSRPEPPTKKPRLASSHAFKSPQSAPRDANVLVVKKRAPKKASLPARSSHSRSPPRPETPPVRPPSGSVGQLVSCLTNPQKRKPKRSITWATPLRHVKCFPKDKESKVSEDYLRTLQRSRPPERKVVAPPTPTPTPARGLIVPTQPWYSPRPLPWSGPDGAVACVSGEAEEQKRRQKAQPAVFYPERKYIPDSPALVHASVARSGAGREDHAAIPSIPLHCMDPAPTDSPPLPLPPPAPAPNPPYHGSTSSIRDENHRPSYPPPSSSSSSLSPHPGGVQYSSYPLPSGQPQPAPPFAHSFGYPPPSSSSSIEPYAYPPHMVSHGPPPTSYWQSPSPSEAPASGWNSPELKYTQEQYLELKILLKEGVIQNFMDGNARSEDAAQIRQLLESMQQNGNQGPRASPPSTLAPPPPPSSSSRGHPAGYPSYAREHDRDFRDSRRSHHPR